MRFGIISDIHGNMHALESCMAILKNEALDALFCLGDIVDNGAPEECIQLLQSMNILCIQGNHEAAILTGEGIELMSPKAYDSVLSARNELSANSMNFLKQLPRSIFLEEFDVLFVHGSPKNIDEYIFSSRESDAVIMENDAYFIINGHTHKPLVHVMAGGNVYRKENFQNTCKVDLSQTGYSLLNPGSVGDPRDKTLKPSCAILDVIDNSFTILRI